MVKMVDEFALFSDSVLKNLLSHLKSSNQTRSMTLKRLRNEKHHAERKANSFRVFKDLAIVHGRTKAITLMTILNQHCGIKLIQQPQPSSKKLVISSSTSWLNWAPEKKNMQRKCLPLSGIKICEVNQRCKFDAPWIYIAKMWKFTRARKSFT